MHNPNGKKQSLEESLTCIECSLPCIFLLELYFVIFRLRSSFVKYMASCTWVNRSLIWGCRYLFFMVILMNPWYSRHINAVLFFFDTIPIGDLHGELPSLTSLHSNNFLSCSSFCASTRLCLYSSKLGNGHSGNNWILCSMFLIGGNPVRSKNNSENLLTKLPIPFYSLMSISVM